jgi:translation initiation factor RLI1
MPKKTAIIDYEKCKPALCEKGICAAVLVCDRGVLTQEKPDEKPDPPLLCVGCGICTQACLNGAVILI